MRKIFSTLAAVLVSAGLAWSASVPLLPSTSQFNEPNQIVATLNYLINSINANITAGLTGSWQTPRNFVDNGSFLVQQRGTGAVTCAQNSAATTTAYGPDRWLCDANVASGAGNMQIVTSSPTLPLGNGAEVKLWRASGILTQPICMWQAIPTVEATALQGQQVVLSAYLQAMANLSADNGNAATLVVLTGTGTDNAFLGTSWTASPAITPAWTGIATTLSSNVTITASWARYQATAVIPVTATEIAVGVCFTPTAAAVAGATDGLVVAGVQLEQGSVAGVFENRKIADETLRAERYFYAVTEPAGATGVGMSGNAVTTTTCNTNLTFPVTMRAAPTFTALGTALSASTWKVNYAATTTTLASTFYATTVANTPYSAFGTWTVSSAALVAGGSCFPVGAGGGSILSWSADL